jgi:hypothetical protein
MGGPFLKGKAIVIYKTYCKKCRAVAVIGFACVVCGSHEHVSELVSDDCAPKLFVACPKYPDLPGEGGRGGSPPVRGAAHVTSTSSIALGTSSIGPTWTVPKG